MLCHSLHSSDRPDNQASDCCTLLHRVRKETEADRRRTVLKLFVGMIGATIKRWQVRDVLRCSTVHSIIRVHSCCTDEQPTGYHVAWCSARFPQP